MEKDSFEREDVAKALNKDFISIKVDREQRPDIDSIYMNAVISLTGQGGWPMSVFLTPEGKAFFGATYIPRGQFLSLLERVNAVWQTDEEQVRDSAEKILGISARECGHPAAEGCFSEVRSVLVDTLWQGFDAVNGGFGKAPKFPPHQVLSLLVRLAVGTDDTRPFEMLKKTLDKMACGGIYDHLGFGFHRYSVDEKWLVPHFEKMLYDNSQLIANYLEAYQLTGLAHYRTVAGEVLEYVLRDLESPTGGFFSAEDAGDVGREGEFYVWKQSELGELLLPEELSVLQANYGVTASGNFEHGNNILNLQNVSKLADEDDPVLQRARKKLFQARCSRQRPHLDDKIIVAWNGLLIHSLCYGYRVTGDERCFRAAVKAAEFILNSMFTKELLYRSYADGRVSGRGVLDDYVCFIHGLLALYQTSLESRWLEQAAIIQEVTDKFFWDEADGVYWYTDGQDRTLVDREKKLFDQAEPSGNGVAAFNLLRLALLMNKPELELRAQRIISRVFAIALRYPSAVSSLLIAAQASESGISKIEIGGRFEQPLRTEIIEKIWSKFHPYLVLHRAGQGIASQGINITAPTTFQLCRGQVCIPSLGSIEQVLELL